MDEWKGNGMGGVGEWMARSLGVKLTPEVSGNS